MFISGCISQGLTKHFSASFAVDDFIGHGDTLGIS
jgi:hypothetical protein